MTTDSASGSTTSPRPSASKTVAIPVASRPNPPISSGKGGCDQAEFAEQFPVGARKAVGLRQKGAAAVMIVMVGDEALGQGLEHFLVFAEVEIHSPLPQGCSPFEWRFYHQQAACYRWAKG
ncbi:hypothetical protein ACFQAQ_00330 [Novosphingobium resinovorum]|uniref:hypothetical protein n=1 Tax=Novosphingobium resinovorum TaxID=158500 RepID=UPI0036141B46